MTMDYELLEKQMYLLEINTKNRDLQSQHLSNINNLDIITNAAIVAAAIIPPPPQNQIHHQLQHQHQLQLQSQSQSQSISTEMIEMIERSQLQVSTENISSLFFLLSFFFIILL